MITSFFQPNNNNNKNKKKEEQTSLSSSSFAECPICLKRMHHSLIEGHASGCTDFSSPEKKPGTKKIKVQTNEIDLTTLEEDSSNNKEDVAGAGELKNDEEARFKKNSFHILMQAAAKREYFIYVESLQECHWITSAKPMSEFQFGGKFVVVNIVNLGGALSRREVQILRIIPNADDVAKKEEMAEFTDAELSELHRTVSKLSLGTLKSILQKSVRRGNKQGAKKAAFELMVTDFGEFLRRLAVIVIEDVMLMREYSYLLWLLLGKAKLTRSLLSFFLSFVEHLCDCKFKDDLEEKEMSEKPLVDLLEEEAKLLTPSETALVHSLAARARYGGMDGDVRMLDRAALVWFHRFNREQSEWKTKFYGIKQEPCIKHLLEGHFGFRESGKWLSDTVPDYGIDFICQPSLFEELFKSIGRDRVERLVWHYWSKINYREKQQEEANREEKAFFEKEIKPAMERNIVSFLRSFHR